MPTKLQAQGAERISSEQGVDLYHKPDEFYALVVPVPERGFPEATAQQTSELARGYVDGRIGAFIVGRYQTTTGECRFNLALAGPEYLGQHAAGKRVAITIPGSGDAEKTLVERMRLALNHAPEK